MIICVSSDLAPDDVLALVENHFGGLTPTAEGIAKPDKSLQSDRLGFVSYDRNQSYVYKGAILDHLTPSEIPLVILANNIFGSGPGARLWPLRFQEKLAYEVYSQYSTNKYGAYFRAAIGTDTSKVKTAMASLDREWNRLINEGITDEELTWAKVTAKNFLIFGIDTKANRVANMVFNEYEGYGHRFGLDVISRLDGVTRNEVNTFLKNRITPECTFTSVVGKM